MPNCDELDDHAGNQRHAGNGGNEVCCPEHVGILRQYVQHIQRKPHKGEAPADDNHGMPEQRVTDLALDPIGDLLPGVEYECHCPYAEEADRS